MRTALEAAVIAALLLCAWRSIVGTIDTLAAIQEIRQEIRELRKEPNSNISKGSGG